MNTDSLTPTIWKTFVHLSLSHLPESFRTTVWLRDTALETLDRLSFLRKAAWLKSALLEERLTILDYFLDHSVWIHLILPSTDWKSHHSLLSVAYNH